jgi:restriction system protein
VTAEDYERFVQQIIGELFGVEVHHQKVFIGQVSQREIKVDLAFTMDVGGAHFLVLVECKHYSSSVSVDNVEEFHSKLDDIGAHKGIMVTTKGYQDGAVKTAKGRGIALALLTKEPQRGELQYVVNSAYPIERPKAFTNNALLQGNIRGPLGSYDGGVRFESFGQLYGLLCIEFMSGANAST